MAQTCSRHWAEALEPRLLHSADLSPLLLAGGVLPAPEHQAMLDSTAAVQTSAASEIVFVDSTLPDAGALLADLQAQQAAGRPLEVVLLGGGDDGLAVIGNTLSGRSGVAAIHLLGHGADGLLQLGSTRLDADTVLQRAGELAAWRGALAPGADILIYGCNVAAGDGGRALVADIAALTGADVAASSDLTGAAAAGGDWVLEVQTGRIDAALAPGAALQQTYAGTLVVQETNTGSKKSNAAVTSLTWSHATNNDNDRLLVVQVVLGSQLSATSVTYGGQALSLLARQDSTSMLGGLRAEVWYLLAPAAGNAAITVTSSLGTTIVAGSASFSNVDQTAPFGPVVRDAGFDSGIQLSVAAASGDIVIDLLGSKGVDDGSFGSGQSKLWQEQQGATGSHLRGSASREDGADAVTMSQRLDYISGPERWVYIAVAVKQAGGNTAPVIDSNGGVASAALAVAENAAYVGAVTASDAQNDSIAYAISGGADAARFTIDAATGELRFSGSTPDVEAPGDADADNVYHVTVSASDGRLSDQQSLTVTVVDVNEFAISAAADDDATADQVLESATVGSGTGITARASDADASNNTVSYSLINDAGGRFSIDAVSGVVQVAGALDRETAASHTIVVRSASSDGSTRTRNFSIAVGDVDEFDTGPLTDADGAANQVSEHAGLGSTVGITAQAVDADATNSAITYSLDVDAGGRFAIDAASGVLRVAGALDFETAASHNVVVRATSADGSVATNTFTVAVNNVSEAGVGTVSDSNPAINRVAENLAPGAATGLTARGVDPDGDPVSYWLIDDAGGRFSIDAVTGVVTAASLNAEDGSSWDVVVGASSLGGSTQQRFTIAVGDSDEFDVGAPVDSDGAANAVDEDAAVGSGVGVSAAASDADASLNAVSYRLTDDAGGRFAIDASSGRVSVARTLDRETAASHSITVEAASADGSIASTSFTIAVSDVNEFFVAAISDNDGSANAVDENAAQGTPVGITAAAADADATNNTISYSLTQNPGGLFAIDAASGVVRVFGGLDFETAAGHRITVRALSSDGSSASTDYVIAVHPANDNAPVFVSGAAPLVAENTTDVTTVQASDADLPAPDLFYSISGGADAAQFSIDAATGALCFASAPDFEQPLDADRDNRYQVEVTASDGSRSAIQSLVVTVADANETPVLTSHAGAASVGVAMTEGGTAITTVAATDPEGGSVSYRIDGGADAARFAVDAATGVLRWISAPDFETPQDSGADNVYDVTVAASDGVNDARQSFGVSVGNRNEAPAAGLALEDQAATEDSAFGLVLPAGAFADIDAGDTLTLHATQSSGAALPSWLRFDPATRSFSGTPTNADVGSLALRVHATDAAGAGAWQDFVLLVANTNDAPQPGTPLAAQAAAEDSTFRFTLPALAFVDIDAGDTLVLHATTSSGAALPTWLAFDAATRSFSGTPANGDVGSLALRVHATDAAGAGTFTDFVLVVGNTNDAPTAATPLGNQTATEDSAFSLVVPAGAFADIDAGDTLTLHATKSSGAALPSWLRFDPATRSFSGTPTNADVGSLALRVHATDAAGAGAWQDFVLLVANTNDAPQPGTPLAAQAAAEDSTFSFTLPALAFGDIDAGDTLVLHATTSSGAALPTWLAFDAATRSFSGTPANGDVGSLALRVHATDAAGAGTFTDFVLVVGNTNDAPTAATPLGNQTATEDSAFSLVVPAGAFADVDAGDTLTLHATQSSGTALPSWLRFDPATRSFSGTPTNADVGSLALRVHATDAAGAGASQDFVLLVANTNDAPMAGSPLPAQTAFEGAQFSFALPGGALADPDSGDRLQFSARLASGQPLPAWLSFDAANQLFSGTPAAADLTTLSIRITATDSSGAQASTDLNVVVQASPVIAAPDVEAPPAPAATPPAAAAPEAAAPAEEPQPEPLLATTQPPPEAVPELLPPTPTPRDDTAAAAPGSPAAAAAMPDPHRSSGNSSTSDAVLAPAVLPQFASLGGSATTTVSWLNGGDVQRNYEVLQHQLQQAAEQRRTAMASGVAISGGLSIGYVVWLVRGGVLMSSMLSTLPAWKMLDPLPVLAAAATNKPRRGRKDADAAEDVERLFDEGKASQPATTPPRAADARIPEEIER